MTEASVADVLITVVIVNWNGRRFLDDCLSSIFDAVEKAGEAVEVVFVDNGSTDGSVEFVRERFPSVRVVENRENLGFARANNQGIDAARGRFVLTLNNDTEVADNFFIELVRAVGAAPEETGMWAVKILSMADHTEIDSVGGLLIYPDGLARGRGRGERDTGQFDDAVEVFMPSACAGLYSKEMLDRIGGFDDDFFAYCEDTDLGLRARVAGYGTMSVPGAKVYHHYSGTSGKYTPFKAFLVERNHLWAAVKNLPLPVLMLLPYHTVRRYAVQVYGILTGRGSGGRFVEDFSKPRLALVLAKAWLSALRGLPRMLARRRRIQKELRKASTAEVEAWFDTFGITAEELVLKD